MNRLEAIEDWVITQDFEIMFIGGTSEERQEFESALLGIATNFLQDAEGEPIPVAVYSTERTIKVYMERDGMDYEEASEFFEFNTRGSYMGPNMPVFIDTFDWDITTEGDTNGGTK
jgi:hypothetical protein